MAQPTVLQHLRLAASLALNELAARLLDAAERIERGGTAGAEAADEDEDDVDVGPTLPPGGSVSIGPDSQALIDAYLDRPARKRAKPALAEPLAGSLAARARQGGKP